MSDGMSLLQALFSGGGNAGGPAPQGVLVQNPDGSLSFRPQTDFGAGVFGPPNYFPGVPTTSDSAPLSPYGPPTNWRTPQPLGVSVGRPPLGLPNTPPLFVPPTGGRT